MPAIFFVNLIGEVYSSKGCTLFHMFSGIVVDFEQEMKWFDYIISIFKDFHRLRGSISKRGLWEKGRRQYPTLSV